MSGCPRSRFWDLGNEEPNVPLYGAGDLAVAPVQHIPDRSPPRRVHLFLNPPLKRVNARLRFLRTLFRLAARRTPVRKPRLVRPQFKLFSTNNARLDREAHRHQPCAVSAAFSVCTFPIILKFAEMSRADLHIFAPRFFIWYATGRAAPRATSSCLFAPCPAALPALP